MDLEETLSNFRERTLDLLNRTQQYNTAIDNIEMLQVLSWEVQFIVPNFPFSLAFHHLEPELEQILESLNKTIDAKGRSHIEINDLYQSVRPAFRVREEKEGGRIVSTDGYVPGDPISEYLMYQFTLAIYYSNQNVLIVEDPFKDYFIRHIVASVFDKHVLFSKEEMGNASQKVIRHSKELLGTLHRLSQTDVDGVFMDYYKLLLDMHSTLAPLTKYIPTFNCPPREVGPTDVGIISALISRQTKKTFGHLFKPKYLNHCFKALNPVKDDTEGVKLVSLMATSDDWTELLPQVAEYSRRKKLDDFDKYTVFEPYEGGIKPIEIVPVERHHIIGQDENIERLEKLALAFSKGRKIPNIVLKGETGVGKSFTMKYLVNKFFGLKLILLSSGYLGSLGEYAEQYSQKPYRTILYIDDMGMHPAHYESFKTGTQGMKEFPENIAIICSVNPEAFDDLPSAIKRRFPVVLEYKFNPNDDKRIDQIFEVHFGRLGIESDTNLRSNMIKAFKQLYNDNISPVTIYDFLVEAKATHGL